MKCRVILVISFLLTNGLFLLPSLISKPVKALEYGMDTDLGNVNASFWGEDEYDRSGCSITGVGDVNGDGYDDILIGAQNDEDGGNGSGQTYLIFGKANGWAMDTDLSVSDASFLGENADDRSGISVAGAGDVNGDGYDDILIGADYNGNGSNNSIHTYLILGKASGWAMKTDLSTSDASFLGVSTDYLSGVSVAGTGDVNGDGYDDILIGAWGDDDGGDNAGQTYLIFGKATGWAMDTNLSASDASFLGEDTKDLSGRSVAGAGDVNGDGYDDILIGAVNNDEGGICAGQTYLIFGKASEWAMNTDLSVSDASFLGDNGGEWSGCSVAGAGDVNGDGYDDILIGAWNGDNADAAGETYLIFGKASGWSMDTNLFASDTSFQGEVIADCAGWPVASAGDVNGDGYDDILIGAYGNADGGTSAGQTYLILGKASGWYMDNDLYASDASFWGEDGHDESGLSVAGAGDVNGDGYDDILVGAWSDDDGGDNAGQTYLIFLDQNSVPTSISSVKAYSDSDYSHETTYREPGDKIYLELRGNDNDTNRKNTAQVWIKGSSNPNKRFRLRLIETGKHTGKFRGEITVAGRTHARYHWINAIEGGWVEVISRKDSTILINLSIGPGIFLKPKPTNVYLNEDENYLLHFNTAGVNPESWTFETNAPWLLWDEPNNNLLGTPTNLHVGSYWVDLRVVGQIYSDEINFTITVNNIPPEITTQNEVSIRQDQLFHVDYDSTDDDQGNITWHLTTNATWLFIDSTTGVLNGTPTNEDVGTYLVNVSVSDGNGGWDHTEFTLAVDNVNAPPMLYEENLTRIYGNKSVNFMFSIMYKDINGDEPVNICLVMGGYWHAMASDNSIPFDLKKGVLYSCTLNLTPGIHQYYYSVSDGKSNTRFPENMDLTFILNDTEKDSDGDGYNDTYERETGSDPYDGNSIPQDWDGDGWNNSIETKTGADPLNHSSYPSDLDGDGMPDSLDSDRDGDGVANVDDPFPDDRDRWKNDTVSNDEEFSSISKWVGLFTLVFIAGMLGCAIYVARKKRIERSRKSFFVEPPTDDHGRIGEER